MRAADELGDAFWDYQHTLYHNARDGDFTSTWFADIAEAVGLDREAFLELLESEELEADVSESLALAASYGVNATPSVVINGQLIGSPTWEELDAAIQAAAETAS
jgi:protein-disulfide isomerase